MNVAQTAILFFIKKSYYGDKTRSLINRKRKRQATFFGHVMRREKMKHLVITEMIEGTQSRGNSVGCWMD